MLCFSGNEVAGKLTLKHVYEIAKIKSQDSSWECVPLEEVCQSVIGTAHSCGIQIVRDLNSETYEKFLVERVETVIQQEQDLEDARQAKMLRVA